MEKNASPLNKLWCPSNSPHGDNHLGMWKIHHTLMVTLIRREARGSELLLLLQDFSVVFSITSHNILDGLTEMGFQGCNTLVLSGSQLPEDGAVGLLLSYIVVGSSAKCHAVPQAICL